MSDSVSYDVSSLTERQREVLELIASEIERNGYPPTIRELGARLGIRSTNGVTDHIKALEKKGFISREDKKSRSLRLNKPKSFDDEEAYSDSAQIFEFPSAQGDGDYIDVPLVGSVAAGAPILAEQNIEDTVRVSSFFLGRHKNDRIFALRVVGESMIEDGIFDGDFLFVKKTPTARSGEIVVAMIEGEATCKRYYPEGDRIRFQPANARMEPIFVNKAEFKQTDILGLVVGVYRKM